MSPEKDVLLKVKGFSVGFKLLGNIIEYYTTTISGL